ncbi:helix-turn-helix domain-containing protein [Enterococcus alishanensis]|uniref:Helix-turn-helix domain-containing protein n=1 Tax=Enterococcus alishanensis TaxID=1303817 RepID=A0ABS6TEU0_9ENTE|nr:helix-turn-helix domain-containing protein [Enterococcus alishanensis]MBV7391408.1 helix-turn-helix domain-containing protein [Enterococcus alishanensis]
MLYEELMLDPSLLLRFNIFKYLLKTEKPVLSISQLSEDMELNYQQSVIELNEIEEELKEIESDHKEIMMRAGKVNIQNIKISVDEYRYHLLKKAVPFQYILYFLNEEEPTIEKFCEKYFVSRSTVSRKIDNLKKHLKHFNIRFTYTEAGMSGDERLIRMALFDILWLGTRGIDIPLNIDTEILDSLINHYSHYFPLSRTYFGTRELRLFGALFLARVSKQNFAKYDPRYNFLMKDNPYYDFSSLKDLVNFEMTPRQLKGESSFIYFIAHYAPFYTIREDSSLKQAIHDFSARPNAVNDFVNEFRSFAKKVLFPDKPGVMDDPLIIGNLLNITFTFFVYRQPFPNITSLVFAPAKNQTQGGYVLEQNIMNFMQSATENPSFNFINSIHGLLGKSFKQLLLPYFNQFPYSDNLKVAVALEHNAIFVRDIYQFLEDLRFVDAEAYDTSARDDYDLIITSSSILQKEKPNLKIFQIDYTNEDLVPLYMNLRKIYDEKNFVNK